MSQVTEVRLYDGKEVIRKRFVQVSGIGLEDHKKAIELTLNDEGENIPLNEIEEYGGEDHELLVLSGGMHPWRYLYKCTFTLPDDGIEREMLVVVFAPIRRKDRIGRETKTFTPPEVLALF
jgi:hypothetical protein